MKRQGLCLDIPSVFVIGVFLHIVVQDRSKELFISHSKVISAPLNSVRDLGKQFFLFLGIETVSGLVCHMMRLEKNIFLSCAKSA